MTREYGPVELRTDRLVLRPFNTGDVDDALAYASDAVWARHLPDWPQPYTRLDAEKYVSRQVLTPWNTTPMFAIEFEGKVVGWIKFNLEWRDQRASMAYALGRDYWGKGLVPEAANAMLDWGFGELGLDKIYAGAENLNTNSQRVMEKVGMMREAFLRKHSIGREGRVDQVQYGILREEWEARRKAHLS